MATTLWITPDILTWPWHSEGATLFADDAWRRPYAHWQHAEQLLTNPSSEFVRTDIVTTLKRAIDHRVRALMGLYDLRGLPLKDRPTDHLELLAYVGLVRPLMVQRLTAVRNAVEHEDAPPPSVDDCRILAEFTWYFLRSTDRVSRSTVDDVEVELPDVDQDDALPYPYRINLSLGPDNGWIPLVSGRFLPTWLANEPQPGWLHVQAKRMASGAEMIEELKVSRELDHRYAEAVIESTDVFLNGELRGPADRLLAIYRRYFELS